MQYTAQRQRCNFYAAAAAYFMQGWGLHVGDRARRGRFFNFRSDCVLASPTRHCDFRFSAPSFMGAAPADDLCFFVTACGSGCGAVAAGTANSLESCSARSRASLMDTGISWQSLPSLFDNWRERLIFLSSRRCLAQATKKRASPMEALSIRIRSLFGSHTRSSTGLSSGLRGAAKGSTPMRRGWPRPKVTMVPSPGTVPPPSNTLLNSVTRTVGRNVILRRADQGQRHCHALVAGAEAGLNRRFPLFSRVPPCGGGTAGRWAEPQEAPMGTSSDYTHARHTLCEIAPVHAHEARELEA
mmetsp:Transcript_54876/g.117763  ORF Transcript_54876/g.117763 Transcript_54876/m.117763 type:complete len:299 (+) Transcript_54876:152-1048(+)